MNSQEAQNYLDHPEQYLERRIKEKQEEIKGVIDSRYKSLAPRTDPYSAPERLLLINMLTELPPKVIIVPQQDISGMGFSCRVDFLLTYPNSDGKLVIECDGKRHQSDYQTVKDDKKRDRALILHGFHVMRFTADEIIYHGAQCAKEIAEAVDLFLIRHVKSE